MTQAAVADTMKKWLTCLGCGKRMWTDRCHRICKKCRRRNDATPTRSAHALVLPHGIDAFAIGVADREQW
ncbi:MAG TPA: hypothetical protein VNE39_19615 [Planctomycetota bacterium]|nr:hypothetical protein [Planctomycetota bacterium]